MNNDYQDRKDIDRLKRLVAELDNEMALSDVNSIKEYLEQFYDQSVVDEFIEDITKLRTDLNALSDSLDEFSAEITSFETDNTKFAEDLEDLQEALTTVLEDVTSLKEGSEEFSDILSDFGIDLTEFVTTLMGLNNDLGVLSTYITAFSGTLQQFDTYLSQNLDPDVYNALNEDMVKLVWAINNVTSRTGTTEGQINRILTDIGDDSTYNPSSGATPVGIQQWIKWIKWKVGDSNSGLVHDIDYLTGLIGSNTSNPKTGIYKDIDDVNTHITNINGLINGDATHTGILTQISNVQTQIDGITNSSGTGSLDALETMITTVTGRVDAILKTENGQETGRIPSLETSVNGIDTRVSNITNTSNNGRLDLIDKQNGVLDQLDGRVDDAEDRLDDLLDTSVTPNTGRIPSLETRTTSAEGRLTTLDGNNGRIAQLETRTGSAEGRLDGITNNNGNGTLDILESKIGNDGSGNTAKTGLYLLIDTVSSTLNNISTTIIGSSTDDVDDGDTTLWAYINQALNSISNAESIMGTDTSTTGSDTVWGRIHSLITNLTNAEFNLGNLRYNVNNLLSPKTAFTYVYVYSHNGVPTNDDKEFLSILANEYGISGVVYACGTQSSTYYKLVNGSWTISNENLEDVVGLFGATDDGISAISERQKYYWEMGWSYAYDLVTQTYYEEYDRYPSSSSSSGGGALGSSINDRPLGYYNEWKKCDGIVNDSFENTNLYDAIELLFAKKEHTHSAYAPNSHTHNTSDISNFPSTMPPSSHSHTKSDISDFSHSHTTSDISNFPSTMPPSSHSHTASEISDGSTTFASINHSHSNWVENTALTGNYHLFTNESLRICILYVDSVSVSGIPSNSAKDVKTFTATEMPHPPTYTVYSNSTSVANNVRLTSDRKLQALPGTGSSMAIATQFMWHY